MFWTLLIVSTGLLYWVYDGYGRFLTLCCAVRGISARRTIDAASAAKDAAAELPTLTVLLTVHNEAAVIQDRIRNILACDYPMQRLAVLIASDGSTDDTNQRVRSINDARVRLFETPGLGKTATQNAAIRTIDSDIIVFTDAELVFERHVLQRLARHFQDARVGAVDARLLYSTESRDAGVTGQSSYWRYELKLRECESQLGILAVVAGGCFALRRSAFCEMDPSIGEDCIVPLDVVRQRLLVQHDPTAIAWDVFEDGAAFTLRRRIRMTLRNWQGTWTRADLLNPFRRPGYAFALWSHKLLRWLSPVFLLMATVAATALLLLQPGVFSVVAALPYAALFVGAGLGFLARGTGRRIPLTGPAFSFLLANVAFAIGIWRAVTGVRITSYRKA